MGHKIVRQIVDGKESYLVWSSIVDAPITYGCSLKQLKKFWQEEYGRNGLRELEQRLEVQGTRAFKTVDEVKTVNRAGKGETWLTTEQIVDYYFVRKGKGPQPVGLSDEELEAREAAKRKATDTSKYGSHCLHPDKCNPDKKHGCICDCKGCGEAKCSTLNGKGECFGCLWCQ